MSVSDKKMQVEAQQMPGFYVVGISTVTSNADGHATDDINGLWQRFFEEDLLHKIPGRNENTLYMVYSDYEGDHTRPFRITLGCKVEGADDQPAGLHKVHVPSAAYAIFAARGEQPKTLLQTWEGIWKMDMPRSFTADVEIYGPRFFEEGLHEVLVCIGVNI